MAFERLRQQKEAEEIARQQREKTAADAARVIEQQKVAGAAASRVEQERIEAERQKALTFRQESGVVDKLREFTKLVDGITLSLDDRQKELHPNPTSILDRIVWDSKIKGTGKRTEISMHAYSIEEFRKETYLEAETFPDGTIHIRGHEPTGIFGFGNMAAVRLTRSEWTNDVGISQPSVFEKPIYEAYKNPRERRFTEVKHVSTYVYND